MSSGAAITLEELLAWCDEAAGSWKKHFEAHPAILELPCGINGAQNVLALVRHIWGAELRWSQRLAGLPVEEAREGPLDTLFTMHLEAMGLYRNLVAEPAERWDEPYELNFNWVPPEWRHVSRRKVAGHSLLHSQRHYAQLATLVREAGYPVTVMGDLLFSIALR
jgi:uncharacterized damage-inducible protein DinB